MTLLACGYNGLRGQPLPLGSSRMLSNTSVVRRAVAELDSLYVEPPHFKIKCPNAAIGAGIFGLLLTFSYKHEPAVVVRITDETGCTFASNGGVASDAMKEPGPLVVSRMQQLT